MINIFGKIQCQRCLQLFGCDSFGEVPKHSCYGGIFHSVSKNGVYHQPEFVRAYQPEDVIFPTKEDKNDDDQ